MPERNRVTPLGDVVAIALRGAWTGNRGRIHTGHEITRFHASDLWITCALEFRGRWNEQWRPTRYTYLFFHDEAVSLAAGHRPCAECRRKDYDAYRQAWAHAQGTTVPSAGEMNRRLHSERIYRGSHRRRLHVMPWAHLPDGTFVLADDSAHLVLGDKLVQWTHAGYGTRSRRPSHGQARVITPPSTVAVLHAGYQPQIDASASIATTAIPGRSTP